VSPELSRIRSEAGRRGAAARWGHGNQPPGDGNQQRRRGVHRRRLDDYAARVVERAAAARLTPSDLRRVKLRWYEITDQADDVAKVWVYEEVGGTFGVDAATFAEELEEITAATIELRINSPGGALFDGIAIYNSLVNHPARVVAYVDSVAASIASVIAMAGDEVVMMPGSQMMIHDALGIEMGNAADMQRMSIFLDRQSDNIADIYRMRAGGEAAEWRELMLAETWMFGREAVDLGLADRVEERRPDEGEDEDEDEELRDLMSRTFNVAGRYRYAGRAAAPPPSNRAPSAPPEPHPPPAASPPAAPAAEPAGDSPFEFDPGLFRLLVSTVAGNMPAPPDNEPAPPEPAPFQFDPERFRRSVMEALT
jgi:ATP-dependent protease ClpP protease subunit